MAVKSPHTNLHITLVYGIKINYSKYHYYNILTREVVNLIIIMQRSISSGHTSNVTDLVSYLANTETSFSCHVPVRGIYVSFENNYEFTKRLPRTDLKLKTYVVSPHQNCLGETVLMRGHNIHF